MLGIGITELLILSVAGIFVVGCIGAIFFAVFASIGASNKDKHDSE